MQYQKINNLGAVQYIFPLLSRFNTISHILSYSFDTRTMNNSLHETIENDFWRSLCAMFEISLQLLWSILAVGGIGFWASVCIAFNLFLIFQII